MDLFVRIEGQTGPVTTPAARAGWFRATSFEWGGMKRDLDPAAGTLTKRRHAPFELVRAIDGASPFFFDAMAKSTTMNVTVAADVPDGKGGLRPSATYVIRAASIAKYELSAVNGGADAVTERIEMTYNAIEVQHDPSVLKYSDQYTGG